jgi:hypothetical protein
MCDKADCVIVAAFCSLWLLFYGNYCNFREVLWPLSSFINVSSSTYKNTRIKYMHNCKQIKDNKKSVLTCTHKTQLHFTSDQCINNGIHWLLSMYIISFTPLVPQLSQLKLLLSITNIMKHSTPLLTGHSYL